ncbi:hypothetical protein SK803_03585 [Lentzea sp. BCCO 10_0856]|uniref:Streptogrisin C n=1 Tax=Lentzea miocenica TaxID=3095431 RepID=A0ABU4SU34_9PSEU|nr:hypothetical protein [Lentzea sp. BCCO 10_0856]MDX8029273.1 hypothetical protein [Lentzea sp. BCCO 10_0856]
MRRTLLAAALAAGTLLAVLPGQASAALSVDDAIPPVADRIFELGHDRGFTSQRTDYQHRAITVRWSGAVPQDVQRYADAKPNGVSITIVPGAKYSRAQAEAARTKLQTSAYGRQLGIVSTSLRQDGSGIEVNVANTPTTFAVSEAQQVAGIEDVQINYGARAPEGYSRPNDAAPWKGGARIRHSGRGSCTSGFAVLKGSVGKLITARHCDPAANAAVTDGAGQQIAPGGASVAGIPAVDSLMIDPSASPATTAKIYRGAWNSNTTSTVKNYASNWPGDPVCNSSSSTGEHCGEVYDDSQNISFGGVTVNVIQVKATSGIMGGQGDSGGPMFKKLSNGVQARGILLGPDTDYAQTTSCGTTAPDAQGIYCSRYINYVPISTILNAWGVSLEVG